MKIKMLLIKERLSNYVTKWEIIKLLINDPQYCLENTTHTSVSGVSYVYFIICRDRSLSFRVFSSLFICCREIWEIVVIFNIFSSMSFNVSWADSWCKYCKTIKQSELKCSLISQWRFEYLGRRLYSIGNRVLFQPLSVVGSFV